jgi:hypothetical protein
MKPIYTLDSETDPFKHNRLPLPFCWGLHDGRRFSYTWGHTCTEEILEMLFELPPGIIYIHNGGKFDIFFIIKAILGNPMRIINGRITKALMRCKGGWHEVRDSYAILPVALKSVNVELGKLDIDYGLMEAGVRHLHQREIVKYLERDVKFLWELCTEFLDMFGMQLTIGTTAMKELRKLHSFDRLTLDEDAAIRGGKIAGGGYRPGYYYGGRVECFEAGIIEGNFKVYDVNSMYPYAMKNAMHPATRSYFSGSKITKDTCFITATGHNRGAFPMRDKKGGLRFDVEYGTFSVTRHEWDMAEELGLFDCERVHSCEEFDAMVCFDEFVDKFYDLRMLAANSGDEIRKLFYKLVMNSAYGKFAQSSENYCEYRLTDQGTDLRGEGWEVSTIHGKVGNAEDGWIVWEKPSLDESMFNVATGSSITGAARAQLMLAIAKSERPIYCDTDSLICEGLDVKVGKGLGEWKLEAECDRLAIGGKKLYALFKDGECVKQANKGVNITAEEIVRVCEGEEIECIRDAPSFKLNSRHVFVDRTVRMTV